ncbi:PP2C family protein-serine/threonine phosphatase [Leptospira sp. GIMC2001]|uniref:PP2C family protein-serine/threonine phosphatase n=1 Tax=Leptospira sp. GIMC2001 TaxID=1513297 RepID=UPI00234B40E8|nr:SpoIIE family protein phosphatase [Leptospira sp. GIMC2001]WCL50591.1 SpoIIE family protein phosphatase [Leptospira sp. GIMC2001]
MIQILLKILLIASVLLSFSCETPTPQDFTLLHGNWEYVWGRNLDSANLAKGKQEWQVFQLPGVPNDRNGDDYLLIRTFLPTYTDYRDPALLLLIILEDFEIFLDGESIFKFGNPHSVNERVGSYIFPHVITLPTENQGKELRIYIHSKYRDFIGPDRIIMITEKGQIMESILLADMPRYLLGCLYFVLAIISFILFILSSGNMIFLYYSLMVLFNGGLTITASYLAMNFFENPNIPVYIYNFNLFLLPVFLYAFLGEIYKGKHRTIFKTGILVYSTYFFVATTLILVFDFGILNLELIFDAIILIGILPLLYIIVYNSIKGDIESRILLSGFIILATCVTHDILADFDLIAYKISIYWYGMFFFLFFQGGILFRRLYFIQKNYELKENELLVAKRIQNSILSPFPDHVTNWEFTSIYEPMKEVGGDFYDILIDDEGNIGVIMIDVSGHGVAAALIASMAKVSFSHCQNILSSPDKVMFEMEKSLKNKMNNHFVTAFYLSLSSTEPLVQFSSAGHPSALLVSHLNNEVTEFRTKSRPIGIMDKSNFQKSYLYLNEGDLICVYTDGVTELNDPSSVEYGSTRLADLLLANCLLPLPIIKEKLMQDFRDWTRDVNIQKDDDLTLILIRYTGQIT